MAKTSSGDWSPMVYNAIKWTAPNQGKQTISYTTSMGITRVPMAYHGGVDWNESGEITEKNIERFSDWVNQNIPIDYCGPVVMDYEKPWWKELSSKDISPERLQDILEVYIEGIRVALRAAPNAQWGYWGLPIMRNTSESWINRGLSLEPLLSSCIALYPDAYDSSRGKNNSGLTKKHIERVLAASGGRMPVYVYVSPRFTGEGGDRSYFVPDDVFLRQVNSAMQAVWIDSDGNQHRIQGLILWDSYGFTSENEWEMLDIRHTRYFKLLQALVTAWEKAMIGKNVIVTPSKKSICQYGLPEPQNSGEILKKSGGQKIRDDRVQEERTTDGRIREDKVQSGRIPSGREN
ncbi:MAG: hypothetical protein QF718_06480 [Phycisphaerales bacterium]|nr:hypothetical protein [Phycisphaerales bacterium]